MDDLSFRLLQFMKEDFGDLGPFFLSKEMKEMGLNDLNNLTEEQKYGLVERLLRNVFSKSVSAQKLAIKKSYLESIIKESKEKKEDLTIQEKTHILMGIPRVGTGDSAFHSTQKEELKETSKEMKARESTQKTLPGIELKKESSAQNMSDPLSRGRKLFIIVLSLIIVALLLFFIFSSINAPNKKETKTTNPPEGNQLPAANINNSVNSTKLVNGTENIPLNLTNTTTIQNTPTTPPELPSLGNQSPEISNGNKNDGEQSNSNPGDTTISDILNTNSSNIPNNTLDNNTITNQSKQNASPITTNNTNSPTTQTHDQPKGAVCNIATQGSIYFESTSKHFYGCDGFTWKQLDN